MPWVEMGHAGWGAYADAMGQIDDRVACILELDAELERLAARRDSALARGEDLEAEREKRSRQLGKHGRHWPPEKVVAAKAQVSWLAEQRDAAHAEAASLDGQCETVDRERAAQGERLTQRQQRQLAEARARRARASAAGGRRPTRPTPRAPEAVRP